MEIASFEWFLSNLIDGPVNGLNMKPIRLLNTTRCSFFYFSSLATLVATFVSWTHFWSHWPRLSRCATDYQTSEFRRFDQFQIRSFMFFIIIFTFLLNISLILGKALLPNSGIHGPPNFQIFVILVRGSPLDKQRIQHRATKVKYRRYYIGRA